MSSKKRSPPPPGVVSRESPNVVQEKIKQLKRVIPECFSEDTLDIEKLRRIIGGTLDSNDEKYTFSWAGRSDTFKNIQAASKGTLIPDKKESVNFDETENIFIEGENLEILKLLQKSYFGKIKMIYIDPPYNTGKDFIYKDDFHDNIHSYLEQTGQSMDGIRLTTNPETSGRFHSDWISFMYARLYLARNLLVDDGVIFISIDDHEVHNLIMMMNEIFGEENYRNCIIIKRGTSNIQSQFSTVQKIKGGYESVLLYSKNPHYKIPKPLKDTTEEKIGSWNNHWRSTDRPTLRYELFGIIPETGTWRWSKQRSLNAIHNYKKLVEDLKSKKLDIVQQNIDKWYIKEIEKTNVDKIDLLRLSNLKKPEHFVPPNRAELLTDVWMDIASNGSRKLKTLLPNHCFDNPKSVELLKRILKIVTSNNDIVLDFFAGSGTTSHAVMEINKEMGGSRKFITIQIPQKNDAECNDEFPTIADICKERMRRVVKKLEKKSSKSQDLGFKVFKLAKSNYKTWENYEGNNAEKLKEQMKLFENPLIPKYKDMDVIYECIIKEGLDLNSRIAQIMTKPNTVYKVMGEKTFYVCLDKTIKETTITDLNLSNDDMFVCVDAALDDSQKTNIAMVCRLKTV